MGDWKTMMSYARTNTNLAQPSSVTPNYKGEIFITAGSRLWVAVSNTAKEWVQIAGNAP